MRHYWTREEAQEAERIVMAERGDEARYLAAISERLGLLVSRNSLDAALVRHIGKHLGDVVKASRLDAPAPASAGVSVSGERKPPEACRDEEPFEVPPPRVPSAEGVERRLILADLHMPVHSVHAVTCALEIARLVQPHVIILNGDLANMAGLSHHLPYAVARETFDQSTGAVRAFIRALRRSVGSRIYVLEGNHEKWARDYEVAYPGTAGGTFDVAVAFGIAPRHDPEDPGLVMDATWVPEERQPLVLGPVAYLHGTNGGEHFGKRYAGEIGPRCGARHVVVGHHHAFQHFSHKNGITAWGCGYLGDGRSEAFDYAKNPRGWEHGVLLQDVSPDGLVTTQKIPIVGGRAVVGGRIIAAAA